MSSASDNGAEPTRSPRRYSATSRPSVVTVILLLMLVTLGACSSTGQASGTTPSAAATATPSAATTASAAPTTTPSAAATTTTIPAAGALNGTWDYIVNDDDRASFFAEIESASGYDADEAAIRLGFANEKWWLGYVFDGELWLLHGVPEGDGGTFRVEGDLLTTRNKDGVEVAYQWALEGESLTLTTVRECFTATSCTDDRDRMEQIMLQNTDHTYVHTSDDPTY